MRRFIAAAALPLVLFLIGSSAAAQTPPLEVRIREVSFATGDETRLIVSVAGPAVPAGGVGEEAFTVTEQGQPVEGLTVEPFFEDGGVQAQQVAVSLLLDVSRSTRDTLTDATAAAQDFLAGLPSSVRVNLLTFGAGVTLVRDFGATLGPPGSAERGELGSAIDGLTADGVVGTRLYDAVIQASGSLASQTGAQHNMVIFSDGSDSGSDASLSQALAELNTTDTAATTVLLAGRTIDVGALRQISDAVDGGAFVRVSDPAALQEAFAGVAQAIANQYVLTYTSTDTETSDLTIDVGVRVGQVSVTDSVAALNQRDAVEPPAPPGSSRRGPLVPLFASRTGLWIGIAAVFAALLLFIGMIFYAPAGKRAERMLARGLRMYTRGGKEKVKAARGDAGAFSGSAVGRAAVGFAERLPRPKQYDEKMQLALDQAAWPLRSTEFILIQVGSTFVGALLGFVLFESPIMGVFLLVIGALGPRLALTNTIQRRESAFLEQLPDTLQLLSGSLQAGYGFLQAIDTVSKESSPPTSTEFARVLTEARLGMPMDEALDSMAERLGSEDFRWVVLAINIQRQVGGNLAQLLTTISNTLREREQVRRQIKVLSAEGRLSAVILTLLPFGLVGYLSVVNPEYLGTLTEETVGRIAIIVALVLMGIGIVWMRKIIKIDV